MKLNTGAMLKTIGVGLVIEVIMLVIGQVANTAMGVSPDMSPNQALSSNVLGFSACLACVGYLLYGVIGAIYGWFAQRDEEILDVGQTALGGGISTAIAAVIGSLGGTLFTFATGKLSSTLEQATSQAGGNTGAIMAGVGVGLVIGLCVALVLSGGLGAAGGAIYAAITRRGKAQPPTTATPAV